MRTNFQQSIRQGTGQLIEMLELRIKLLPFIAILAVTAYTEPAAVNLHELEEGLALAIQTE